MMRWTRRHGPKLLPIVGALVALTMTGGSLEASDGRLAAYYLTTLPWGSLLTVVAGGASAVLGSDLPPVLDPILIAVAGAMQGVVLAVVVYGVLRYRRAKESSTGPGPEGS
ncbi:hypothetical protein [Antribacter gilvus]|uniref:hypothetical protein n=1 Tax=Antribacter gilvus TaxID=2304675 RepID=UPI000F79EA88|nr:hypothetical protein [Antribacter gilvus]